MATPARRPPYTVAVTQDGESALADLVRDFLAADLRLRALFDLARAGNLRFDDVPALVGDDRESLLFRLKERSHALYRLERGTRDLASPRQALFDLAVGSLFHEAMKLRENLYQTEVYAPKVRALQASAGDRADPLFDDFEKILTAAGSRLIEALDEAEALLDHTRAQFRALIADHRDQPLIARTLVADASRVEAVFEEGLDEVLAAIWGSAADGYATAARSFLDSAYFDEALEALGEAEKRSGHSDELSRLARYAQGMRAFQSGAYAECLERLGAWVDAGPRDGERAYAHLAASALSRLESLIDAGDDAAVVEESLQLLKRLQPIAGQAIDPA